MRIVAGQLGGRLFDAPHNHKTHPMSDKVRGALFNMLGDLEGLSVLDAFGGTGALAFEAISRGAKQALIVENDRSAQQTIERNIRALELDGRVRLVRANVNSWLSTDQDSRFDIVLCDPPYDNLQEKLLSRLVHVLAPKGTYVLSWPGNEAPLDVNELVVAEQRDYGDAQLIFYHRS